MSQLKNQWLPLICFLICCGMVNTPLLGCTPFEPLAPLLQSEPPSIRLLPKTPVTKEKIRRIRRKTKGTASPKSPQTEETTERTIQRDEALPIERPEFGQTESELKTLAIEALISATQSETSRSDAFEALRTIEWDGQKFDSDLLRNLLRRGLSADAKQGWKIFELVESQGLSQRELTAELVATMDSSDLGRREQVLALLSPYRDRLQREVEKILKRRPRTLPEKSSAEYERCLADNRSLRNQQICGLRLIELWGDKAYDLTPAVIQYFNAYYDQDWFNKHQNDPVIFAAEDPEFDYLQVLFALSEIGPQAKAGLPIAIHASKSSNLKTQKTGILCIEKIMAKEEAWMTPADERKLITLLEDSQSNREQIQKMFETAEQRNVTPINQTTRQYSQTTANRVSRSSRTTRTRSRQPSTVTATRYAIESRYGSLATQYDSRVTFTSKLMKSLDEDDSGFLSEEELVRNKTLPEMDTNHDGVLHPRELLDFYMRPGVAPGR